MANDHDLITQIARLFRSVLLESVDLLNEPKVLLDLIDSVGLADSDQVDPLALTQQLDSVFASIQGADLAALRQGIDTSTQALVGDDVLNVLQTAEDLATATELLENVFTPFLAPLLIDPSSSAGKRLIFDLFSALFNLGALSLMRRKSPTSYAIFRALGVITDNLALVDWSLFRCLTESSRCLSLKSEQDTVRTSHIVFSTLAIGASLLASLTKGGQAKPLEVRYGWDEQPGVPMDRHVEVAKRTISLALGNHNDPDNSVDFRSILTAALVPEDPVDGDPGIVMMSSGELGLDITERIRLEVGPVEVWTVFISFDSGGPQLLGSGGSSYGIKLRVAPGESGLLLGDRNASQLRFGKIGGGLQLNDQGFGAHVQIDEGLLRIDPGEGDSFLAQLLGETQLDMPFELALSWSPAEGLQLEGGAGLRITLPARVSLGAIQVRGLELGISDSRLSNGLFRLDAGFDLYANLEPFQVSVDGLGFTLDLATSGEDGSRGNLGILHVQGGFKPPRGVGLSMDTETVKLGGYLSFDADNHRYVGAVELVIADSFSLNAIGLITTRFPDGSKGFSLLFIVSSRFASPIPLGYNFYLSGVGGLLGLNRSVDIDRLRSGLQQGTVDDILFPENVVANMNALVTDLREIFPATRGQFLVGPMAEVTWNTPPLFTGEVGLIIEFANPTRIAILGVMRVAVPNKDDAIVDLKVNFLGTIDFDRGLLAFDASIYDSFIGYGSFKFSFEGDMALRISWGAQPDFLTSVGGFHPAYSAPNHLSLPPMRRLTLSLLKDNPRLTLTSYFAVTTNTVQFGAALDFYYRVSGFSVVGDFGFDVLFQFTPFSFIAAVRASLAVKAGSTHILSLGLSFELSGTSPWNANGSASFRILFVKVKVKFNKTWGERKEINLPRIDVLPTLIEEFSRNENWSASLSDLVGQQAILLPTSQAADSLLFDPGGMLSISQNVLPLATPFSRFGNNQVADIGLADVAEVRVGNKTLALKPVQENFAPATIREMADQDKLEASSYVPMKSGVSAQGGDRLHADHVLTRQVRHERIVSDSDDQPREGETVDFDAALFRGLTPGGAIGRSAHARAGVRKAQVQSVLQLSADNERFAVVSAANLQAADANSIGLTRDQAEQRIQALIDAGANPAEFDVVPAFQMAS